MTRFAEQSGVGAPQRRHRARRRDDPRVRRVRRTARRPCPRSSPRSPTRVNFGDNEASGISAELGPGASVYDGAQVYLDRQGLQGDARRQAEFVIHLIVESGDNYEWERISLDYWANYESPYTGVGQGEFPVGGYRRLIEAMAGDTRVRLRHRVHAHRAAPPRRRGALPRRAGSGGASTARTSSSPCRSACSRRGSIAFEPEAPEAQAARRSGGSGSGRSRRSRWCSTSRSGATRPHTHMLFMSDHAPLELPLWLDLNEISGAPGAGRDRRRPVRAAALRARAATTGWRSRSPA